MILTPIEYKNQNVPPPLSKASGNLTLQQFFDLMFNMINIERPDIIFAPSHPRYVILGTDEFKATMVNPNELFVNTITHFTLREEPGSVGGDKQPFGTGRREVTPRVREIISDNKTESGLQFGQWMDTLVQFDIWALTNYEAETLSLWFKRFMTTRRGFLKNMGLSEILFWWRGRDPTTSSINNSLHSRSLIYYIRTEELMFETFDTLKRLEINVSKIMTD